MQVRAMMRVSVVIPAYNARDSLELCLLSLAHQEGRGTAYTAEVIVVDDGSTDGTGTMVAEFGGVPGRGPGGDIVIRYVHEPRTPASGRARARNIGLRHATGDLVVLLDADQMVGSAFLAEHVASHTGQDDALVVLGPRFQLGEGTADRERLRGGFSLEALPPVVRGDEREPVFAALDCGPEGLETAWHYMWTCNVSVRRSHLTALGGFDEAFVGWGLEDSELGYRLKRAGARFARNPSAVVYHEHRNGVTARMHREWRRNLARFERKHDDPVVLLQRVFDPVIDPSAELELTWIESAVRFELAARALRGRGRTPLGLLPENSGAS
ncbi:glycosyltransferase family 2 protein [Streptomyces sp. NPDC057654]|uniref:glycosyltransferase family 2 protein n=1 Tax=Streptomyces sp. NPDC057654 TaxID=3346196 RepID=UPI0036C0AE9A